MDEVREQTGEAAGEATGDTGQPEGAGSPSREIGGRAGAVVASLALVSAFAVSVTLALDGIARYAFQGQDSSTLLTRMIVVMSVAIGVPLAAIVGWGIRHRHLTRTGRPHRRAPLVTACVCLLLGLPSIWLVTSAVERVEHDAVVSFQRSLDVAQVEKDGVAHLEWMARSLTVNVLGEPEIVRESCVLADGSRGTAPTVVVHAAKGRVAADDLGRVAMTFWRSEGYDPHEGAGWMTYISGTPLEDPYVEILVIANAAGADVHELSYHGVCMELPPSTAG